MLSGRNKFLLCMIAAILAVFAYSAFINIR
jgi:hypothetical protein